MEQLMPKQVGNQLMLNSANFITLTVVLVSHKTFFLFFFAPSPAAPGGGNCPPVTTLLSWQARSVNYNGVEAQPLAGSRRRPLPGGQTPRNWYPSRPWSLGLSSEDQHLPFLCLHPSAIRPSVSVSWRSFLRYRHACCQQLSHRRPP